MGNVVLSERLQALADMVTPGRCVVDVGCDHGFVSIYLVQQGISPRVLAMDVRKGPLSRAQEHVAEYRLEDYIETRLSDGLCEFHEGEAQSLVCAGMGGRLMTRILTDSREKAHGLEELILQPQSELSEFREFLKRDGYELLDENILCEDGKYYFLMKVRWSGSADTFEQSTEECAKLSELYKRYGELLLKRRSPILKCFLEESLRNMQEIEQNLKRNDNERARNRLAEVRSEIVYLKQALVLYEADI